MRRAMCIGFVLSVAVAAADDKGVEVTLGALKSRTPAGWEDVKTEKQFRLKEFKVPGADAKSAAELVVFGFNGAGGGFEANLQRWKGMFKPPEGKTIDEATKIDKFEVGKAKVTLVDITGTYLFKANPMAPKADPRPDHRMLMAFFDAEGGPFFIRLVGPEKTVTGQKKAFEELLKNFK